MLADDIASKPSLHVAIFVFDIDEAGFAHTSNGHKTASDIDWNLFFSKFFFG